MNIDWTWIRVAATIGFFFGSFVTSVVFVGRMVYVNSRERWRKSVEPPRAPERFRQRTISAARPHNEDQQLPVPERTARVRPIRRFK